MLTQPSDNFSSRIHSFLFLLLFSLSGYPRAHHKRRFATVNVDGPILYFSPETLFYLFKLGTC